MSPDISSRVPISSRRARRQRGNYFIESALTFLPLCIFSFAIIDFSLVIFLQGMYQSAVRDGVRFAITFSTTLNGNACATQSSCITQVVQSGALGFLNGTTGASYIQINYYTPDNLSTPITSGQLPYTVPNNSPSVALRGTVINYVNQYGNVVEVKIVNYPWNWLIPATGYMPGTSILIGASSSDILQGYPVGTTAPPTA